MRRTIADPFIRSSVVPTRPCRLGRRLPRVGPILLLALGIAVGGAQAEAPKITVEDNELGISRLLTEVPSDLEGQLRVTSDTKVDLQLLAYDLRLEGSAEGDPEGTMPRSQISLKNPSGLEKGIPTDLTLLFGDVQRPGIWTGQVKLRGTTPGSTDPIADSTTVELKVRLELGERPKVEPIYGDRTFHLVRCQNGLTCKLASWILDGSAVRSDWSLVLDNTGEMPVKMKQAKALVQSKTSEVRPPGSAIILEAPGEPLAPGLLTEIPLTLEASDFDPDQYTGQFRFHFDRAKEPVSIETEIFVRQGPVPALLVLIFGIFIGRLARSMQTDEAKLQTALYPEYERMRALAAELKNEQSSIHVDEALDALKNEINRAKKPQDELTASIGSLENKILLLLKIEKFEQFIEEHGSKAQQTGDLPKQLQAARKQVLLDDPTGAEATLKQIQESLAISDGGMGEEAKAALATVSSTEIASPHTASVEPRPEPGGRWLGTLLGWAAGVESYEPEIRYWLVRPLLWLTLLVALALFGLESLYVNKPTFGSGGVFDFLGLFIWGVTSDVARQGLLSLRQTAGGKGQGGKGQGGKGQGGKGQGGQ